MWRGTRRLFRLASQLSRLYETELFSNGTKLGITLRANMSVYNHRPMVPAPQNRIIELLDAIRAEFDNLARDVYVNKTERDGLEQKSK